MADVVEASQEVPVIVDFWAPWCGPCKTLGPALEAAVTAARGKVRMVKVNVDENQMIAQQLRIQSIPTVYAFWQGRPVDAFQGALPPSELKAFVDKLAALAGDGGLGEALDEAEKMLAEGAAVDAAQLFAAILGQEPENAAGLGGLARAHVAMGELDQAEALLANAPAAIASAKEVEAARAQIALARQAANAGPVEEFRAALEADPNDHQARFDLAQALYARATPPAPSTSCWSSSAATASGTTAPPEPALHHLRRAQAQRPAGAEGPPPAQLDDICLTVARITSGACSTRRSARDDPDLSAARGAAAAPRAPAAAHLRAALSGDARRLHEDARAADRHDPAAQRAGKRLAAASAAPARHRLRRTAHRASPRPRTGAT
jgi:putative thioredoxin